MENPELPEEWEVELKGIGTEDAPNGFLSPEEFNILYSFLGDGELKMEETQITNFQQAPHGAVQRGFV